MEDENRSDEANPSSPSRALQAMAINDEEGQPTNEERQDQSGKDGKIVDSKRVTRRMKTSSVSRLR